MQCVHTNLMCAPGDRTGFDQRGSLKPLLHFKACFRWLASGLTFTTRSPLWRIFFSSGACTTLLRIATGRAPVPDNLSASVSDAAAHAVPAARNVFGDQQNTGSIAVKPVHQFQEARLRTQCAHRLNHTETQTAAAVYRRTRRFINHQNMIIFIQYALCECRNLIQFRRHGASFSQPHAPAGYGCCPRPRFCIPA